jgi:hypothetical protein
MIGPITPKRVARKMFRMKGRLSSTVYRSLENLREIK